MNQNLIKAGKSSGKFWTVYLSLLKKDDEFLTRESTIHQPFRIAISKSASLLRKALLLLKPPRILGFTKFGTLTVLLTLGLGLSAMNTGNNLLYMIFGMILGFIAASGVLSEMSLRGLETGWLLPSEFYAGRDTELRWILKNKKEWVPSFGVSISVKVAGKFLKVYFLYLPPQSQKSVDISFRPEKRGEYAMEELRIETKFPFSFFKKYSDIPSRERILVYPRLHPLNEEVRSLSEEETSRDVPLKGRGDSFWGMKDFAPGDNPRQISWKTSAKRARLMVRETERETEKKICVSMEPMENWRALKEEDLEKAVSFTASFIWEKFKDGVAVGFVSPGLDLPPSTDKKNVLKMFYYLSLFSPSQPFPPLSTRLHLLEHEVHIQNILSLWIQQKCLI